MPATSASGDREAILNVRTSVAEREQVRRFAAENGTTVSGLLRRGLELQGFKTQR